MQVKYKLTGDESYSLLFDEAAGDANETFAPSFRDTLQKIAGYGAANMLKVPLANTDGHVQFKWSSNYDSADDAVAAIATLRAVFKGVTVDLQIIVGETTLYLPNACLIASSHDPHGKECLHILDFDCDDITTTAP